jgi:hypothetical protein
MVKRTAIFFIILTLLLYAGCVPAAMKKLQQSPAKEQTAQPEESVPQSPAIASPGRGAPDKTGMPAPETGAPVQTGKYSIQGTKIIREDGGTPAVIYDAAEHYGKGGQTGIEQLVADADALYFAENSGDPADSENPDSVTNVIVRIDPDGGNRQVLYTSEFPNGFNGITGFGDWIFFVEDGFDSVRVGYAAKGGGCADHLDFSSYAAKYKAEPDPGSAELTTDGEYLYAEISLYVNGGETVETHRLKIDKDLKMEPAES